MKKIVKFLVIAFCIIAFQCQAGWAVQNIQGPTLGNISSGYGFRVDPFTGTTRFHHGLDIAAPLGTPIYAMQDGLVTKSGKNGGYGLSITIRHFYPDIPQMPEILTTYGHCSVLYAQVGQFVRRGQIIALIGSTGRSTGPHLHFEVTYLGHSVDPIDYLTKLPSYLDYVAKVRSQTQYAIKYNYSTSIGGY